MIPLRCEQWDERERERERERGGERGIERDGGKRERERYRGRVKWQVREKCMGMGSHLMMRWDSVCHFSHTSSQSANCTVGSVKTRYHLQMVEGSVFQKSQQCFLIHIRSFSSFCFMVSPLLEPRQEPLRRVLNLKNLFHPENYC